MKFISQDLFFTHIQAICVEFLFSQPKTYIRIILKGHLRLCNLMQSDYSLKLWPETICPSSSFFVEVIASLRQRFCNQEASWSSSCGWTEELCSQHISKVGVLVTYWDPCIDWLVMYLELCFKRRDCYYITSPIVYQGKGSAVGWYKVLGFLYL